MEGYLTSLTVQYRMARERFATAIAAADQLAAVSANSPLGDRVSLLAAECEQRRGRVDRSLQRPRSLLRGYPGSPLASEARRRIAGLETEKSCQPAGSPSK